MSIHGDFLRSVEVRPNSGGSDNNGEEGSQGGSSLWTKAKLEPGQIVGVIDKVGHMHYYYYPTSTKL
jgi:hypothetical protein